MCRLTPRQVLTDLQCGEDVSKKDIIETLEFLLDGENEEEIIENLRDAVSNLNDKISDMKTHHYWEINSLEEENKRLKQTLGIGD